MKKLIIMMFGASILAASCSSNDQGELVGVQDRTTWYPSEPYGMVNIPQGSFNMGNSDQDVPNSLTTPTKTVSVGSFWIDQTEITNNEYRQFVNWVRDSILRYRLGEDGLVEGYELIDASEMDDPSFFDEYKQLNYPDSLQSRIDWEPYLEWNTDRYPSQEYTDIMQSMYLPPEEMFLGRRMVDSRQLVYTYYILNKQKASRKSNRVNYDYKDADDDGEFFSYRDYIKDNKEKSHRASFFESGSIHVYPDTLAWVHDFTYSYNDPMHDKYFWHPAYDEYPVVGVNWNQAVAFCNWRTKYRNDYLKSDGQAPEQEFRLPTEAEWEYSSRGGQNGTTYPWGGPYTLNSAGCYLGNFKPRRGNLSADGGMYTVAATAYAPNGYNLYNMAGNVSEWTNTAYEAASYYYISDISPNFEYNSLDGDEETLKRKVVRGGSWKDVAYYLQNSTRDYEYQDTAKCYVGFRTVQSFMGRDLKDF